MKFLGSVVALPFLVVFVSSTLADSADPAPPQPIPQSSAARKMPAAWDKEAAAKYLDERMDLWFGGSNKLGPWTWSKASPPSGPEAKIDASLLSKSDGYGTGLIAYALRQAALPADHPSLRKATAWLEANQRECQIDKSFWKCWRAYSLNHDHEHGGNDGEPWKRIFMSDAATAFAALALLPSD